ncbi:MAG: type I methionyl aminopeptidase [Planctomycetaceae bacterium]|nr:type I methionyl aminopeptidase [Planctomycetaceae bacterium]
MITLKSRREIELMAEACQLVVEAHRLMRTAIAPGMTTAALDRLAEEFFASQGAEPLFKGVPGLEGAPPFPAVTCISVNHQVVHGIPGAYRLREGDILSVDTGCRLRGWCGDGAWTYAVGPVSEDKSRLLAAGEAALLTAVQGMGTRKRWSQVARLIERGVRRAGFSVVEDFVGHGIGREMHEDPEVPNYFSDEFESRDFPIKAGLVLAIEPMVNAGGPEVELLDDHWTVVTADRAASVHFEHTVAMTKDGPLVLTEGLGA